MKSNYDDFMIITKYIMILTPYKRPYFGLIIFAQSRQPLLESTWGSLTNAVSNMTDVVFNMIDTVVTSLMICFSEKE